MSRKKLLRSILFIVLIAVLVLTACQPQPATPAEEAAPADEAAPAEEAVSTTEEESAEEPLTFAFIYSASADDYGYNWMWDLGRQAVEEKFGDRVDTVVVENIPFSEEATRVIEQLIADGADMIFDAATLGDFAEEAAATHPEVAFLRNDLVFQDNEVGASYEMGRPYYLYGVAAGLLTKTNKIGFVNAFPAPYVNGWANAIALGAQSVNPDAEVTITYIGSFYDPSAALQASGALVDSGADVLIGYVNGDTVMNAAEERGAWTFGYYHPMVDYAPNQYVTSNLVDSSSFFINEVQAMLDGTWVGDQGFRYISIENGMSLDTWGPNVPQDVQDQVEALFDRMANESYNPFTGPIYDAEGNVVVAEGEELTEINFFWGLDWLVPGVNSAE